MVPSDKLAEHYEQVQSFQQERARSVQRINKALMAGLAVSLLTNLGLGWSIASMLPLEKLVPMPIWVRPDGSVDAEADISRLPKTVGEAVLNAEIWKYVHLREGYAYATARYGYDAVSLMSSDTVRNQYQDWFNYPNPKSPQVTVGRRGQIDAELVSISPIGNSVMQVRFRKTIAIEGQRPQVTTWTATVQYQAVSDLPAKVRIMNPAGLVITSYQSSEDGVQ